MAQKPATTFTALRTPLLASDGTMSWTWQQWFLDAQNRIQNGLNQIGDFIGKLTQQTEIAGRGGTIGSITGNLDDAGVVTAAGIDFARPYVNKTTDYIEDGEGSPLSGGKAAYSSLINSAPVAGRALIFSGAEWAPQQVNYSDVSGTPILPENAPESPHLWLSGYNAASGLFTQSQPNFADLGGAATAAQVPALSALEGQITTAQLPASGFTGTVPLAKLTTGGTDGSFTVTNGIITAVTNPT